MSQLFLTRPVPSPTTVHFKVDDEKNDDDDDDDDDDGTNPTKPTT